MTVEIGARLVITYNYADSAAGWGANVNRFLQMSDAMLGGVGVLSAQLGAPPSAPAQGDAYIVASGATGAWAGEGGSLAVYQLGTWQFFPASVLGFRVYAKDQNEFLYFNGTTFVAEASAAQTLTLESLADVEVTSPVNQQFLGWNTTDGRWENMTLPATPDYSKTQVGYSQLPSEVQALPFGFIMPGKPAANGMFNLVMAVTVTLPAAFAGTVGYAATPPAANAVFAVNQISGGKTTAIGTITMAPTGALTFTTQAAVSLNPGDVLQLRAPYTQDAALADVGLTILAKRT